MNRVSIPNQSSQRPAGQKAGRTVSRWLGHATAVLALSAAAAWFCRETVSSGMRDEIPYGCADGELAAGGAVEPLGVITSEITAWELRGIGGPLGVLIVGWTDR